MSEHTDKDESAAASDDPALAAARAIEQADDVHCANVAEVLRAVAHPLRLRIVALLAQGDEIVGRIAERLDAKQAIVSQQLRILRMNGLVHVEREGGTARYSLARPGLRRLLQCVGDCSGG